MAPASPAAMPRASFLACLRRDSREGRAGRDFDVVIATSFHESPVPRWNQAERRRPRTRLRPNRWECSLAAGGWRPVSALPAVSRGFRFDVKRAAREYGDGRLTEYAYICVLFGVRRKPGSLVPLETAICAAAAALRRRGINE